jgi:hypothetical protein
MDGNGLPLPLTAPLRSTPRRGTVDRDSSMGSVLMEMHEKLVSHKNSFTMERYGADKEEDRKALQPRP